MAVLALTERQNPVPAWEGAWTITNATSDPLMLPFLPGRNATVAVIPGANSGKVQYTISSVAAVLAGTANWHDWGSGVVSASTIDRILAPCTAIRFVATGAVVFEVLI